MLAIILQLLLFLLFTIIGYKNTSLFRVVNFSKNLDYNSKQSNCNKYCFFPSTFKFSTYVSIMRCCSVITLNSSVQGELGPDVVKRAELETAARGTHAVGRHFFRIEEHMLQISVGILIYFEVNIKE